MARKRTKKPAKYTIQHGKLQHVTSARRFAVWLRDGLLIPVHSHLARVSDAARTLWDGGELILQPRHQPGVSLQTYAQAVDRAYLLAHGGKVPLDREVRLMFLDLRSRLGEAEAEPLIRAWLDNERQFALRAQYGWL